MASSFSISSHFSLKYSFFLCQQSFWISCFNFLYFFVPSVLSWLAVWLSGYALASINVVALRQTRLVLSPSSWQSRGDRKGGVSGSRRECETTPFVFSNMPVYSTRSNMRSDMIRSVQCSYIRSTTMSLPCRVPATFASRDNELA